MLRMFAHQGANITLISRDSARMQTQVTDLQMRFPNQQFDFESCDLSTEAGISALEERIRSTKVDVLIKQCRICNKSKVFRNCYGQRDNCAQRYGQCCHESNVCRASPDAKSRWAKSWLLHQWQDSFPAAHTVRLKPGMCHLLKGYPDS